MPSSRWLLLGNALILPRAKLAQDIRDGQMQMVVEEARKQVDSGAPILDVNMGVPGIDEVQAMQQAIGMIQSALDAGGH